MAALDLSTYTGLKDAVAQFLGQRTDLVDQIPAFIRLGEAEIARRLRRKTITKTVTIGQASTALPADCAELRNVRLVTSTRSQDRPLRQVTPEVLAETRSSYAASGRPIAFSVIGSDIILAPEPDAQYSVELRYFEKLVPLSDAVPTNGALADSPDLYLYSALLHAAPYLEHDERIVTWTGFVEKAFDQIEKQRTGEEMNASLHPARLPRRLG